MGTQFIEMIRQMFSDGEQRRIDGFDEQMKSTEGLHIVRNLIYGDDSKWNTFEIIYPETENQLQTSNKLYPVLLQVHGGGWIYGSTEGYQYYSAMLARHGYAVVTFNYRLAPDYHFPAPLEDMEQMLAWIDEHAEAYHLDRTRMFGIADSAGAHTLACYVTTAQNPAYARWVLGHEVTAQPFQALILNSGVYQVNRDSDVTDFIQMIARAYLGLPRRKRKDVLSEEAMKKEAEKMDRFEFMNYITSQFPPSFLLTSADDFVKMHSVLLAGKLCEKSVMTELHICQSDQRKLDHTFQEDLMLPEAEQCNEEEMRYLQRIMEWKRLEK